MDLEWRNSNQLRRYPFNDRATMISESGNKLADDVVIDAVIYPFTAGTLWMSELNLADSTVTFSSSGGIECSGSITGTEADLLDSYGRRVGTVIFGDGLNRLSGKFAFSETAAPVAQACVFQQPVTTVSGFILPDGSLITGDVTFEGMDGVRTVSYTDSTGRMVLRIDGVGVPETPECVDLTPPILCIDRIQTSGSNMSISRTGNHIIIGHKSTLEEACDNRTRLPDEDGNLPTETDCDFCPTGATAVPGATGGVPGCPPWPDCPVDPPGTLLGCPDKPEEYFISAGGDLLKISPYDDDAGMTSMVYTIGTEPGKLPRRKAGGVKLQIRSRGV